MANALKTLFTDIAAAIRETLADEPAMSPSSYPDKIREVASTAGSGDSGETVILSDQVYGLVSKSCEYVSGKADLLDMSTILTPEGKKLADYQPYALSGFDCKYMRIDTCISYRDYVIAHNENLKILDLSPDESINALWLDTYSLYDCPSLETIIIRGEKADKNVWLGTSFGETTADKVDLVGVNDTFYIYVPSISYDKAKTNNPTYASRIRKLEDYPDIDGWYESVYGA